MPNFLQAEVHATAGVTSGLPYNQIIARYRSATDHLIAVKRANYQAVPGAPLTKAQADEMMSFLSTPGYDFSGAIHFQLMLAQIGYDSIRFLTVFNSYLIAVQAQLNEAARQLAQRQAEEATRLLAQRQAEEAARLFAQRQAQETARLLAQQQAEEVARQLAQLQAEEAARQFAQRQAEQAALLAIRPQVEQAAIRQMIERAKEDALKEVAIASGNVLDNLLPLVPGPQAFVEFEDAAATFEIELRKALADFNVANLDTGVSATDAFNAMLHAFKQTGVDAQAVYEGVTQ